ncbi:glycoside hydrolase [Lentinus tigrinus ALCF2SS1-7]|uniref:Glycoside hydrolase n=1 Tax=Lentinus tigrinus ALCF2SS1-6 TaxID=1328759 RepID=A0A5C2RR14_9APHY|nr:glycoside hydrolase [Lentinus tigrinus ALCF2SS1-6]RPD70519.1 glycoside hydrolase [Lentinus tigrinus ALCF2SS1-7]
MHSFTYFYSINLLAATLVGASHLRIPRQSTVPKLVVAHHIVGLTANYSVEDWVADISLAQANAIDGFALNIGTDDYTPQQVENAFLAAEQLSSSFKLFLSFDMTSYHCAALTDADPLRNLTLQYATRPNQFQVDGQAFVSAFSGETCTFGQGDVAGGWRVGYTQHPDIAGKIHFVPSFFVDPATFSQYAGVLDGDFNWNSAWPIQLTASAIPNLLPGANLNQLDVTAETALQKLIGSFDPDTAHITSLATTQSSRTYMAAVSPWFFTHFPPNTYNKNFVYDCDEHLWVSRWETLIANRDHVDFVEILTWNDFGESHYIGPKHDGQALPPGSEAWVDGFDHTGWLGLTSYFATAFKTGATPPIEKDQLVMWARPHPKSATPADPVGPPRDFQILQDKMWAVVLATADGQLTLSSLDADSQTFDVREGVNKLSLPLIPGGYMRGVLTRGGQTVIDLKPDGFVFNPNPPAYNFNAFVANATAA